MSRSLKYNDVQRKGGGREGGGVCVHGGGVDLIQQQYKQTGVITVKQQCHNPGWRRSRGRGGVFCLEMLFHFEDTKYPNCNTLLTLQTQTQLGVYEDKKINCPVRPPDGAKSRMIPTGMTETWK